MLSNPEPEPEFDHIISDNRSGKLLSFGEDVNDESDSI